MSLKSISLTVTTDSAKCVLILDILMHVRVQCVYDKTWFKTVILIIMSVSFTLRGIGSTYS